ncbi:MAG: hypothetical protein HC934_05115 [Acaryochloridaceae cyanobacterium SU_2_1]|nr:hypothetical protein [Acaryochloridaceae cyanobacterium SU_2_1]NJM95187.1 hypothetical protein [Acaryochloridaceae cyanobacterium CSU_5_19]
MNPILFIAAIIVTWLVFTWLLKVVKTTLKTAVIIAGIVLALQVVLGIGPDQVVQAIADLPQMIQSLFSKKS